MDRLFMSSSTGVRPTYFNKFFLAHGVFTRFAAISSGPVTWSVLVQLVKLPNQHANKAPQRNFAVSQTSGDQSSLQHVPSYQVRNTDSWPCDGSSCSLCVVALLCTLWFISIVCRCRHWRRAVCTTVSVAVWSDGTCHYAANQRRRRAMPRPWPCGQRQMWRSRFIAARPRWPAAYTAGRQQLQQCLVRTKVGESDRR